jgi:hypothetical protein
MKIAIPPNQSARDAPFANPIATEMNVGGIN